MKTEAYKSLERKEKLKAFQEDQRGKRNNAQFKSRGRKLFLSENPLYVINMENCLLIIF